MRIARGPVSIGSVLTAAVIAAACQSTTYWRASIREEVRREVLAPIEVAEAVDAPDVVAVSTRLVPIGGPAFELTGRPVRVGDQIVVAVPDGNAQSYPLAD